MTVGVVDIGTNSMRLLVTDGHTETGRWVEVTGLGRGVDRTGELSEQAMGATLEVLRRFGDLMNEHGVARRKAIATSASRDASNREEFFDGAASALGVRPTLITGEEEARYAYRGAVEAVEAPGPIVVSDVGGGSTEFVTEEGATSVDVGSVRITERAVPSRPAPPMEVARARELVTALFAHVRMPSPRTVIGVAGTWTSLAALAQDLPEYARDRVHGYLLTLPVVSALVANLARLTLEETEALPSLDPKRAPVILGGAIVAERVMRALGVETVQVSEHDTLDGVAMELLALR